MKKLCTFVLCLLIFFAGCNAPSDQILRSENVALNATNAFMKRIDSDFYLLLSASAKNRITEAQLTEELDSIVHMYGTPIEIAEEIPESTEYGKETIVSVPVRFPVGWMNFQYRIDANGSVNEFTVTVSDMMDENGYNEIRGEFQYGKKQWTYVYTKPNVIAETTPVVIFVHDKDAYDRNSTAGVLRTFRTLAYELADNGISSVRYDRSVLNNASLNDTPNRIMYEVRTLVTQLKKDEVIKDQPVILFGYGLGGYLLPYIASNVKADKFIIANSPARDYADCVKEEQDYLIDEDTSLTEGQRQQKHEQAAASLEIIHDENLLSQYEYKLLGYTKDFWEFLRDYDALEEASALEKPVLVVGGSNDYAVPNVQFNLWQTELQEKANVSMKFYKDMDHWFIIRTSESNPKDILSDGTVSRAFIKDLLEFIRAE